MTEREVNVRLRAHVSQYMSSLSQASTRTAMMGTQVSRTMRENKAAFTAAGAAAAGFGVATGAALKNAGDQAIETQATFTKLQTQIGLTAQEAEAMREAALGMADTGRGVQELGESMFFVASAGLRGEEALEATESAAKAAAIGLGETEEIAGLTTAAMNAYGSEALDATQATDVLLGAVREGSASAEDFAGSLGQVLPIASNMGVTFDEVGAAVAAMTRTGTNANTATMQLRQMLSSLLKPADQTRERLDDLGLSVDGVRATIADDGLWQALQQLSNAAGDNQDALGELFPDVQALSGFLDLTGESAETTEQIFGSLADTTGLLEEGFEEYSGTAQATAERSAAAWENTKDEFGRATLGMRANLSSLSESLATWLGDLDQSTQTTVVHMATAASAVSTLGGAALIAGPRIVETTQALGGLRRVAAGGLGIGAVTYATFQMVDAFHEGKQAGREMVDEIIEGADSAEDAVAELGQSATDALLQRNDDRGFWERVIGDATPFGRAKREVEALAEATELWGAKSEAAAEFAEDTGASVALMRGEVENLTGAVLGLDGAMGQVGPTRERAAALEDTGEGMTQLERETRGAGSALEDLSGTAAASFAPVDVIVRRLFEGAPA